MIDLTVYLNSKIHLSSKNHNFCASLWNNKKLVIKALINFERMIIRERLFLFLKLK